MRDYNNRLFNEIAEQIADGKEELITVNLYNEDFTNLQFFLTRKFYYTAIIDDYPFGITDKDSLLEALYYQIRLITVHDLNWDAIQEGLGDALNNFLEFEGICLLFRQGNNLINKLPEEFNILNEIIQDIMRQGVPKKIKVILNVKQT